MTAAILFLALSTQPHAYPVPYVAQSFHSTVDFWADYYLVPRFLARKVAEVESSYDPAAKSRRWVKEGKRWVPKQVLARGLFQISVEYQAVHVRSAKASQPPVRIVPAGTGDYESWHFVTVPYVFHWDNPSDSARVGLRLLRWLLDRYDGDQMLSVAAYNMGYPALESSRALPLETIKHLRKVFG